MNALRLGLIGCGGLGNTHARCVAQIDGADFVAYVDTAQGAATKALDTYGGGYATTDAQRLWADDSIDAVYICTRHDSHAALAIAAARSGKHILIEKPVALSMAECESVAEAVAESGVYLMPAFKMRYYPLIEQAKAFIPQPQVLVGQMMDARWPDDQWIQDPVQGGANVHSQGCHMTDVLRYLAGSEPIAVSAMGGAISHPGHPCIDQCVASIQFANGHVASWVQGDAAPAPLVSKFFIELFGDGRSVQLTDRFKQATFFDGENTWTERREEEEGFLRENQAFVAALQQGREPELTAYDGLQATRIVLAADQALRTHTVQRLDAPDRDNASPSLAEAQATV